MYEVIDVCYNYGINVYVDIVMNYKVVVDEKEMFYVIEVDFMNWIEEIFEFFEIEGWIKFIFEGCGDKYFFFKWNFNYFNGIDYDDKNGKEGVFCIVGENKSWNENVD